MKTNEKKELRAKTKTELEKGLKDANNDLRKMKLEHQQAKLKNTSSITNQRKRIAVIKSILKEKSVIDEVSVDKGGGK